MLQGIIDNQKTKDKESSEWEDSVKDRGISREDKRLLHKMKRKLSMKKEVDEIRIHLFSP